MKWRKFFTLLGVLLLLWNCQTQEQRIGVLFHGAETNRWNQDRKYFEQGAQEHGVELLVEDAQLDASRQLQQAKSLLEKGVKVLIVIPVNANIGAAIVREAHKKGVPVIAYERLIRYCDLDYFIGADAIKVGEELASFALKSKPKGNYILIHGERTDQNSVFIRQGEWRILNEAVTDGRINIVYEGFSEGWSPREAGFHVQRALELTAQEKVDVVISANDGMAGGITPILKKQNLNGKTLLTGQDATLEACKRIQIGDQSMTIFKSIKELTNLALGLACDIMQKEKDPKLVEKVDNGRYLVPAILQKPLIITKDNMEDILIEEGFYSVDELRGN